LLIADANLGNWRVAASIWKVQSCVEGRFRPVPEQFRLAPITIFQSGAPPLLTRQFQAQPRRRYRRVAPALFGIGSGNLAETETG